MKIELKPHEYALIKGTSIKLDADTVFIVAHIYHSTPHQRGNSDYRYEARIAKISDVEAEIQSMMQDANRLNPWLWPSESMKDKAIVYGHGDSYSGAKWLKSRIKKALPLDIGFKRLQGYKLLDPKTQEFEHKPSWSYETLGYTVDGTTDTVDILDVQTLLSLTGKSLTKHCPLKTQKAK